MSLKLQQLFRLRSAAIVLSLIGVAALPACAQDQASPSQPVAVESAAQQNLALFSSSLAITSAADDAIANEPSLGKHFGPNPSADQYGGPRHRRPYGRPTYKDRNTNPDGSTKFAFEAGAGFAHPAGVTQRYQTTGYNLSFGAGRNFSRVFGVLFQYDYANMGIPGAIVNALNPGGTANSHLWSLTLNPIISFSNKDSHYGGYIVGGGGFYRKMTIFNVNGTCFDPSIGFYSCSQLLDHVSNNAGGLNAGLGFTYRPSLDSNLKIFAEARYTWVDNQPNPHSDYPENNFRTGYFPVTFGVRF